MSVFAVDESAWTFATGDDAAAFQLPLGDATDRRPRVTFQYPGRPVSLGVDCPVSSSCTCPSLPDAIVGVLPCRIVIRPNRADFEFSPTAWTMAALAAPSRLLA